MPGNRDELIEIFQDTQHLYRTNPTLKSAIDASIAGTRLYPADQSPHPDTPAAFPGMVQVTKERSLEAAGRVHAEHPDWRIAVHNFASATNPGGGVERGSSAQEEAICRITTLFPCINTDALRRSFYGYHRKRNDLRYSDATIYTPDVVVFKSDDSYPQLLPESEWFHVDILTCAAPNLREVPYNRMNPGSNTRSLTLSKDELWSIHVQRAEKLLNVSLEHGADCVILGAFGCGAFRNSPEIVAGAYRDVVSRYRKRFKQLVFAVFCSPRDTRNYDAFKSRMR